MNVNRFLTSLEDNLLTNSASENSIIFGDLNINWQSDSSTTNRYKNLLMSYGLKQVISTPTRITKESKTLIDHIIVSKSVNFNSTEVLDAPFTDHQATRLELDGSKMSVVNNHFSFSYRLHNAHNVNTFKHIIENAVQGNWLQIETLMTFG